MTARVKRQPRVTKREKKKLAPQATTHADEHHDHIHCTACGKHIEVEDFDAPATALWLKCQHGSEFSACVGCKDVTQRMLDEHDRTGEPVKFAPSFH
jgi:hypothetical protein